MKKFQCSVCGYIYNPEKGVIGEVEAGTSFEDVHDDWVCPACGAGKEVFEAID